MKVLSVRFDEVKEGETVILDNQTGHFKGMKISPQKEIVRGEGVEANLVHFEGFECVEPEKIVGVLRRQS